MSSGLRHKLCASGQRLAVFESYLSAAMAVLRCHPSSTTVEWTSSAVHRRPRSLCMPTAGCSGRERCMPSSSHQGNHLVGLAAAAGRGAGRAADRGAGLANHVQRRHPRAGSSWHPSRRRGRQSGRCRLCPGSLRRARWPRGATPRASTTAGAWSPP